MSNAVANGFAGAGAGIVAQIITYPLQIVTLCASPSQLLFFSYLIPVSRIIVIFGLIQVNTRQQTERTAKKNASVAVAVDGDAAEGESSRKGTLFQMLQVIKTEGWGGLYSGLTPSLVGTAASQVYPPSLTHSICCRVHGLSHCGHHVFDQFPLCLECVNYMIQVTTVRNMDGTLGACGN